MYGSSWRDLSGISNLIVNYSALGVRRMGFCWGIMVCDSPIILIVLCCQITNGCGLVFSSLSCFTFFLANLDMDLCCLIDSEEKLNASDLVTMVGDLLERGMFTSVLVCLCISANLNSLFSLSWTSDPIWLGLSRGGITMQNRNEIPREASTTRPNTNRQAILRAFSWTPSWYCLWHWIWK